MQKIVKKNEDFLALKINELEVNFQKNAKIVKK
jgi:hypothetical protein